MKKIYGAEQKAILKLNKKLNKNCIIIWGGQYDQNIISQ